MRKLFRIGQIVPSSKCHYGDRNPGNAAGAGERTAGAIHLPCEPDANEKSVKEELAAMDVESDRCALELSDARVDVLGYACLVAIMSMGLGYHRSSATRLHEKTRSNCAPAPVVTSAGALIEGLQRLGARRVSIIAPYMKPLTNMVVEYILAEGIEVVDSIALEIPDNLAVAAHDPELSRAGVGAAQDQQCRHRRFVCMRPDALAAVDPGR